MLTLALMPREGQAQGVKDLASKGKAGKLDQNYPNPFNPESRAKFSIGEDYPTCADRTRQYRVTLVILNAIGQRVATPQIEGSSGGVAGGQRIQNVLMTCGGPYIAYWNGKVLDTQREAASGVYTWILTVDGKFTNQIKSTITK